ncbi:MAG: sulfotransferase domain-containing protein [Haliea sp.]|nr:sulfotransferase domain-containing protein [Haliea sp.]
MVEVTALSEARNYKLGENWYRAHFPTKRAMQELSITTQLPPLTGEATPSMNINTHAGHAHALVPQAKLIIILRNPVDRTYSHYQHQKRKIRETLSFGMLYGKLSRRGLQRICG